MWRSGRVGGAAEAAEKLCRAMLARSVNAVFYDRKYMLTDNVYV